MLIIKFIIVAFACGFAVEHLDKFVVKNQSKKGGNLLSRGFEDYLSRVKNDYNISINFEGGVEDHSYTDNYKIVIKGFHKSSDCIAEFKEAKQFRALGFNIYMNMAKTGIVLERLI